MPSNYCPASSFILPVPRETMGCEETTFPCSLMASTTSHEPPDVWWKVIIYFCGVHLAAAYGVYRRPPSTVPTAILVATIVLCQLANYGCVYVLAV